VLEGLPINQYREVEITVGANAGDIKPTDKDAWPELPMPRDSHMLPEHSQQLLRAARSGRIYKPPAPPEDDNEMEDKEEESKEVQTGFTIKKYVKIARHLEVTEPEYLAKRREGLPSQYVANGVAQPVLREAKVKKLDAEGNATVYKVLVPEGQTVPDEVQPTDAAIEAAPVTAAPGTIVEGVGVVNARGVVVANDVMQQTPPRRRAPPPKKKRGGPGRKKRVVFVEGAAEQGTSTLNAGGESLAVPGLKQEGGSVEPSDGDTPMADAGGDDDEGSGDDGSEDEDHEGEHISHPATPATPSRPSTTPTSAPNIDTAELSTLDAGAVTEPPAVTSEDSLQPVVKDELSGPLTAVPETIEPSAKRDPSSSPDLPLSTVSHSRQNSLTQIPTSATIDEPEPMTIDTTETAPAEPVVEPSQEAVVESEPAPMATDEAEAIQAPSAENLSAENLSAPPSEPDLMASLDRHLEKDSEDIAGS
jgi:hypothetical protein